MPKIEEILILHHSHLDVGYTHSQPIQWNLQQEYLDQVLDWLEETASLPEGARPKWTCEATEPVRRWLRRASATQIERFRKLVRQGRLGLSALRWHSTPLADRAGLERLLCGKRELEELTGLPIQVACQHDVTGTPWPLADVLLDAGVDFFVMAINIHLGRAVKPRPGLFLWEAPSGRRLRVWNGNHYTMFDQLLYAWDNSVERMAQGWSEYQKRLEQIQYPHDFLYLSSTCSPVMWDNAPNNPFLPELIAKWNESGLGPRVRYATFDDLRRRAASIPDAELSVQRGDWTDYWNFGAAASPIATQRSQAAKPLLEAAQLLHGNAASLLQAKDLLDTYDEHTCGYYDSNHEQPMAQTTELLKQALAHEGHEHAAFALMDGLEKLAANPVAARGLSGLLLVNPGDTPRTVTPEIPETWFAAAANERTYRASRMFYDGRSWRPGFPGASFRSFAPVELPPRSWQVLALDQLQAALPAAGLSHGLETDAVLRRELNFAPAASHQRRVGRIESPFYTLRYDPDSGRILTLFDKIQQRDLVQPAAGLDCFAFVRERSDALVEERRYAFYQRDLDQEKIDGNCWQPWSPVRERATRVLSCGVRETPHHLTFERMLEAPGCRHLVQRFRFSAYDPVIAIELELELLPEENPQGFYFALPTSLDAGWEAGFDTAGALVRVDQDQLPGACRNWVTAASFAWICDAAGGLALFTPEAPLVQFGGFHFGPPLDTLPRPHKPLLLAWPVNNYWDTNIPRIQSGRIQLRYGLLGFGATTTASELQDAASRFRQPQLLWPVSQGGRGPGADSI